MRIEMLLGTAKFVQMMAYLIPKIHSSVDAVLPFGKMRIVIGAATKLFLFKETVFLCRTMAKYICIRFIITAIAVRINHAVGLIFSRIICNRQPSVTARNATLPVEPHYTSRLLFMPAADMALSILIFPASIVTRRLF